jgi:hypothetical protein
MNALIVFLRLILISLQTILVAGVRRLCRCHRNCHRAGERGTGDDAEASLSALLLPSMRTSVRHCRCHRHRTGKRGTGDNADASSLALLPLSLRYVVRSAAVVAMARSNVKRGTGDDAEASSPPLSPLSTRTSVRAAAATTIAIAVARASKVQVMMPRHHRLPCCCRQRA